MKRLLFAAGAIAATTIAIEKVIEYAMKLDENDDMTSSSNDEPYAEEVQEEFISLNPNKKLEEMEEAFKEESAEEQMEEPSFDAFVDETGDAIKEIGGKVREFLSDLPKISITINVDKNEK